MMLLSMDSKNIELGIVFKMYVDLLLGQALRQTISLKKH